MDKNKWKVKIENITNWAEKLEKRKSFKDYFNLIS